MGNLVLLEYVGDRVKAFNVRGGVTRTMYFVPGSGKVEIAKSGQEGVAPSDVAWFLAVNGGNDYRLYVEPEPEPEPEDEDD